MTIVLHHFLRGPLKVTPIREAEPREWWCPDRPMLRPMGDGEFCETRERIDALLAAESDWGARVRDAISHDQRSGGI